MALGKFKILPDSTGYTIIPGNQTVVSMLAGGAPRVRMDQLGMVGTTTVQWTVGPKDADYILAFRRLVAQYDTLPFLIDLLAVEDTTLRSYQVQFVPGTFKLASQSGLTYVFQASLWVVPAALPTNDLQIVYGLGSCGSTSGPGTFNAPSGVDVSGQSFVWCCPSTTSAGSDNGQPADNGYASSTTSSGSIQQISAHTLDNYGFYNMWAGFSAPTLPTGAVVKGIYAVLVGDFIGVSPNVAPCDVFAGPNLIPTNIGWSGSLLNSPDGSNYLVSPSLSLLLSDIASLGVAVKTESSMNLGGVDWRINTSYIALVVAYE